MREDANFIWLGDGISMTRSVQEDYEWIAAHLREGDRAERDVWGRDDRLEDMETSWTVRDGQHIVCNIASVMLRGDGVLSRRRGIAQLTTEHVWSIKVKYVRFSPRVLAAFAARLPPWVTDLYTLPMESYAQAIRWDERILGFRRAGSVDVNGVPHALMWISRRMAEEGAGRWRQR